MREINTQIDNHRLQFNEMSMQEKRQFIERIKQQLEKVPNTEWAAFLNECIQQYNAEARGAPSVYSQSPAANQPAAGGFVQQLHMYGRSNLFLAGIILYSVGSALSVLLSFEPAGVLTLILLALPVTALWLIYAASKAPEAPEKTLASLTLFKIVIITLIVAMGLGLLGLLLVILAIIVTVDFFTQFESHLLIGLVLIFGIIIPFVIFYCVAGLKIIKGIRNGIIGNSFVKIQSVTPFLVMSYIFIGFEILAQIALLGELNIMPSELMEFGGNTTMIQIIAMLFSLAATAGWVLILIVIGQFCKNVNRQGE